MQCRDARDALLEITTGRTPPDLRRAMAAHLSTCDECRGVAGELEEAVDLLRAVPDQQPPDGFWPGFMLQLEERIERQVPLRARIRRFLRTPPALIPAAATAAVALLFAVSSAVLHPPEGGPPSLESQVAPYVADSMRSLLPHLEEIVQIWSSGLGAEDAEPLFESAPPR